MLKEGLTHTSEVLISPMLTAIAMGSGDLDVFATPAMVALMENAAMKAVKDELDEGYTTVGAHLDISHLRPSKRDKHITATATPMNSRRVGLTPWVRESMSASS